MRLRDMVKNAPRLKFGDRLENHGPVVFRGQGRVVYDREKKSFVKPRHNQGLGGRAQVVRSGFLDRLKGMYEDARDKLVEGYQHGKDLVEIGLKHGLPAAAEYEAEVIKGELRDAKINIILGYVLWRAEMDRAQKTYR